MARYDAIRSLGESLLDLMREACPMEELQLNAQTPFEMASFNKLTAVHTPPEGFYLCLWRVGIGAMPRCLPPRQTREGQVYKPSLPIDLYFLLLPVSTDAAKQACMLGWALRFMHDVPPLSGEILNRYTKGAPVVFRPEESVEIIADPLNTADYLGLWDRVKTGFQAGMTYVARMVLIDSIVSEESGRLVTERQFAVQKPEPN